MVLDRSGQVLLIAFEMVSFSYRYFDLGYFIVMCRVTPWLGWCEPHGAPALTPEVRRQYLEAYPEAKCEHEVTDRKYVSSEEYDLMELQHQVLEFASIFDYIIQPLPFVNEPTVSAEF